ncbi:MAG: hypothetical protein KJO04_06970 [Bacteroidia bacterium]|nr:hypothetical protein [Bacteroidia bacterium]
MSLEFVHILHPNYIEVQINGVRTRGKERQEAASMWKHIFEISDRYGLKKILVQARHRGNFPINAHINFALQLKEIGCTLAHRIAYVTTDRQIQKNPPLIFGYMQSAGYEIQVFKRKEEGKRWLLGKKKRFPLIDLFHSFK